MKNTTKQEKNKEKRRRLLPIVILLFIVIAIGAAAAYIEYNARPGELEEIWIADRGADYITVGWKQVKNADTYVVTYNGETVTARGSKKEIRIDGLTADTEYEIYIRADSKDRKGFEILEERVKTKALPSIEGAVSFMKFKNRPVDLKQTAETPVTYSSPNGSISSEGEKVIFNNAGNITITAKTDETEDYASVSKEIAVEVLDTVDVDPAGAVPHVIYRLNKDNCERVKTIEGVEEAVYPQAFLYHNGEYLITYIRKDAQRIITYGDRKTVHEPKQNLGHANGLAMANGVCYMVEGYSGKCTTFEPPNDKYGSFDLPYSASGIAYDDANDMFYTTSRQELIAYDSDFKVLNRFGRIRRTENYFVQDCTAYGGILMQGVSGADEQGINYIDFYDMTKGKYLGTVECDLNEIESLLIDDEGYIEILCNTSEKEDYIWKSPLNMKMLCE